MAPHLKRMFSDEFFNKLTLLAEKNNKIYPEQYQDYDAKVGLRNRDGTGVLIGLTEIGEVKSYNMVNGKKVPVEGQLFYRGIEINDLVKGFESEERFGFEETCFLLLFGELPSEEELDRFKGLLCNNRTLPANFTEDMILKAPSNNIMNKLARNVLTAYSFDKNPDDISVNNVLRQSIQLIAQLPTMAAYGYQAKVHNYDNQSLFIHKPQKDFSTSQNLLHMIRADNQFSQLEAEVLDLNLVIHAEHGGGNNSTFAVHVVSSTDTDTYSAIAAAIGSLKGPRHGGANIKVIKMIEDVKEHVKKWDSEKQIEDYLAKIIRKKAFDRSGLIYGMGHAVYTLSDPRALLLKEKARELAKEKQMEAEFELYNLIEKIVPRVFADEKGDAKHMVPNVDFYSGLVYKMLNIPVELFTPIFAIARMPGWLGHRIEEIVTGSKVIRPAYKCVISRREYIPLDKR